MATLVSFLETIKGTIWRTWTLRQASGWVPRTNWEHRRRLLRCLRLFSIRRGRIAFVVSNDPTPGYELLQCGMNVFTGSSGVFPDPSQAPWLKNVNRVLALTFTVVAPVWEVFVVVGMAMALILGLSAAIIFSWRQGARRSFKYIEIPNYMAHGVKTNINAILQDDELLKLEPGSVLLGALIGQGGQGVVRKGVLQGRRRGSKSGGGFFARGVQFVFEGD